MDAERFAELTKRLAAAPTRRGLLGIVGVGLLGGGLSALGRHDPTSAQEVEAEFICRGANFPCSRNRQCCAGRCRPTFIPALGVTQKLCGCNKKGADCIKGIGRACCSGRCRKGKCK
jgi:hypothetical protein